MREIEIKARVEDISGFKAYFEQCGFIFGDTKKQDDIVFIDGAHATVFGLSEALSDATFVRLRTENNIHTLAVKKRVSSELDCIEESFSFSSISDVVSTLKALGYAVVVHIQKQRIEATSDNVTICLDIVEGLGSFIEIEELCDDNINVQTVLSRLEKFIEDSELNTLGYVREGYDSLLYKNAKL